MPNGCRLQRAQRAHWPQSYVPPSSTWGVRSLDCGRRTCCPNPSAKRCCAVCLIDKVVVHRVPRDEVQTRIVWKGGATTTLAVPVTVGAFIDLQGAAAME